MTEDSVTTGALKTLPDMVPHILDRMCTDGECVTCQQNIALATLHELRALNAMLKPLAEMANTRVGMMRGFLGGRNG